MNTEAYERYSYSLTYAAANNWASHWYIYDGGMFGGKVVFECPHDEKDQLYPPKKLRDEYERLIEWKPGDHTAQPFNIVEAIDDATGGGFNQRCVYGSLVPEHSVYCHNTSWLYAPRKCRRTWYTGGKTRDEDCEGYSPNPNHKAKP